MAVSEELHLVQLRGLTVCTAALLCVLTMTKFSAGLQVGTD